VVQSEKAQWLLLSTAKTPKIRVNSNDMHLNAAVKNQKLMSLGYNYTDAEIKVVADLAKKYHMVLYEGRGGVFGRANY